MELLELHWKIPKLEEVLVNLTETLVIAFYI